RRRPASRAWKRGERGHRGQVPVGNWVRRRYDGCGCRWHGRDDGQDGDEGQQGGKPSKLWWSNNGNHLLAGRPSTSNVGRPLILGGAGLEEMPPSLCSGSLAKPGPG